MKSQAKRLFYKSETHPSPHFTLPQSAFLPDLIRAAKLLHVFTEVAQSTVLCAHAGFTFSTHASGALNLWTNPKYSPQSVQRVNKQHTFQLPSSQRLFADSSFYESEILTRDPRRPSDLKSGVSGWLSVPSASDSFSRLFLGRYLISKELFLPRPKDAHTEGCY